MNGNFRIIPLLDFGAPKSALISIFFSYKEISVPKIALKPLVPVRLRAVLPSKTVLVRLCAVENRDF